jgi:UDP-N-acetylmuramoylalanine--D-glutamate ligase
MSVNIGILGFGVVGKSVLHFLKKTIPSLLNQTMYLNNTLINLQDSRVSVWDKRELEVEEIKQIEGLDAYYIATKELILDFLESNDYIVVSPGFDLREYSEFKDKWICELDLFSSFFTKPVLAITGTLGKTTITSLIGNTVNLLPSFQNKKEENKKKASIGGNIGNGMLKIIEEQNDVSLSVLELSSFQLEYSKKFAADITIWTNFYPNHLDWHANLSDYFEAKWNIFKYQNSNQISILSVDIFNVNKDLDSKLANLKSQICFVSSKVLTSRELNRLRKYSSTVFFARNNCLYVASAVGDNFISQKLMDLQKIPKISFAQNWIFILSALYMMGKDLKTIESVQFRKELNSCWLNDNNKSHRMEFFAAFKGSDFYNDSKSTVVQSTKQAFSKLDQNDRPIILIMGGLGKGVDRSYFLKELPQKNLKSILCFGKEAAIIGGNKVFNSLDETVKAVMEEIQPGDQVLFSPGGASFDLFENYKQRGNMFKELVKKYGKSAEQSKN